MTDVPNREEILDLIGEFGAAVCNMLDDCETSGPIGNETHTITSHGLKTVGDILDRIDGLPFEEAGYVLGTGAKLQAAIKQTYLSDAKDARIAELEAAMTASLQRENDTHEKLAVAVALAPEILASLDATGCNVSLAAEYRATLAQLKGTDQ